MGVPVFAADIKGDLTGLAAPSAGRNEAIERRLAAAAIDHYTPNASPVVLWDLFGESGHPVRTTISEMGPLLLSNLLELNDNQQGLLFMAFRIADEEGLLLLDLKDLRAMLAWMGENRATLSTTYGNVSTASIGAIQRRLLVLESQGGDHFFGEPALSLDDLMRVDASGRGVISLLDATRLIHQAPRLYSAFLLWILAELFEQLPEQGDSDRPKLVFFFDEAHMLFSQADKTLRERIEQVVRLIRSKGVGVYFVSQQPTDLPDEVLGQLGLKIQHALRAFTPKDRKAIRAVAENFRATPGLDVESTLTELAIGEALVSLLDEKGAPTPVERVLIRPPESRIGPLDEGQRRNLIDRSPVAGRYDEMFDRHSAFEMLRDRANREAESSLPPPPPARRGSRGRASSRASVGEAMISSAARAIGSQIGRQLIRGLLGSLFGGRRR
jgi:DNA helicase HerA-like ATPase